MKTRFFSIIVQVLVVAAALHGQTRRVLRYEPGQDRNNVAQVTPPVGPGQSGPAYQKPPKAVLDILNAPSFPQVSISPGRDHILLIESVRYPSIAELAQPMLRLAGLRINPTTNGPRGATRVVGLTLVKISDGVFAKIALPDDPYFGMPHWSSDGKSVAFTNTTAHGIELWVVDTKSARARKIPALTINAAYGDPVQWMPDQRSLLVQTVPAARGRPPVASSVPRGPTIQENEGKTAPVPTFQDLLENTHDEDLFDYYAAAQLGTVDVVTGKWNAIGKPGIFQTAEPSPDGTLILVARVHRPYSYLVTHTDFPREVEVWDRSGTVVHKLASLPLQEQVAWDAVPIGPRNYRWRATDPATLVWVEALDEGNPRAQVPYRDRILIHKSPFQGNPVELAKTEFRFARVSWLEKTGSAFLEESDRRTRWTRTWLVNPDNPGEALRKIWDRNSQDVYNAPGTPVTRVLRNGQRVILQRGDSIFLTGAGSSPEGDRPFLDRLDLRSLQTQRLFRTAEKTYETVIGLLSDDGSKFLTRYESPAEPPNLFVRSTAGGEKRALTRLTDPAPQLRNIRRELVTYRRADGVQLSFTLYVPPDYKAGTRLPTVVWAYPLEYTDAQTASQISGSPYRFLTIEGPSPLFFLTQGYAVLDNASMPVVGDLETVNNTYLEQIVASAKAAIDKAVERGVTDRDRVGVGGHSYGAFMTANLLAHSDLFRAGIARSGAYNRTLTPFGFQQERRTLWEAPDLYIKVSPFMNAHKIDAPTLLVHGEADNNTGTFPIQSERFYHALKGHGKTARYVTLPLESHGYQARESIEHTLYEMISWFERYVKDAPPRAKGPTMP